MHQRKDSSYTNSFEDFTQGSVPFVAATPRTDLPGRFLEYLADRAQINKRIYLEPHPYAHLAGGTAERSLVEEPINGAAVLITVPGEGLAIDPAYDLFESLQRDNPFVVLHHASTITSSAATLRGEAWVTKGTYGTPLRGSMFLEDTARQEQHEIILGGTDVIYKKSTESVSILAIVNAFNEEDIIDEVLQHLLASEVHVHVVDNWSTDRTCEVVLHRAMKDSRVSLSRFPETPGPSYQWFDQLRNVERIAWSSGFDWILHNDADELRYAPWPGVTLRDAVSFIDSRGYSAIDLTVIDFRFTSTTAEVSGEFEKNLHYFEFGKRPGHFVQVKGWRNNQPVDLASSGGHEAKFVNRRVYPLKFLNKHYPLRSSLQAEKKVFRDRLPRFLEENAARGWHTQYDRFAEHSTIPGWSEGGLIKWDNTFEMNFLIERLSGLSLV